MQRHLLCIFLPMRYILCAGFFVLSSSSFSQIVNIETKRVHSDTTGWFGKIKTGFVLQQNANRVLNINGAANVEYKSAKDLYIILLNYNLLRANGKSFNNNVFSHLRYRHDINSKLSWEAFTQLQNNNVSGIDLRMLAGTGPRLKLISSPKINFYAATAAMYEYERELTNPPVLHHDARNSTYLSLSWNLTNDAALTGTLFYQPLFRDFTDYRVLNELNISYKLFRHFAITVGWYYLYDSAPAAGTPKLNYSISNGFEFVF